MAKQDGKGHWIHEERYVKNCKWVFWFDWSILAFDLANLEANVELKEAFDDGMKIVEAKTLPIENEVKVLRILMDQRKYQFFF